MGGYSVEAGGRDLAGGVSLNAFDGTGMVAGAVDGEAVLLVRVGSEVLGVDGACTHYGGPLVDGLVVGETVRCPWHHACFSLRTGRVLGAPAQRPLGVWRTRIEGDRVWVEGRASVPPEATSGSPTSSLRTVAIVGAGAAGSSAARTLREEGYAGAILLIDPDAEAPYDRPNLSKDYLAGTSPADWLPLWPSGFCAEHGIERIVTSVEGVDVAQRRLQLADGTTRRYDTLLIASGPLRCARRSPVSIAHTCTCCARCRTAALCWSRRTLVWSSRARASSASRPRRRCARAGSK